MKCLFLDLASIHATVACVTENETVYMHTREIKITDSDLMKEMETALQKAKWEFKDLTHIAVVVGPGGFMNLRIGVTAANVLSHELKIPIIGIHLSDLYAARASSQFNWLHSTKKEQVFIRGESFSEPTLIHLDQLPQGPWAGELIEEHAHLLKDPPVSLKDLSEILPELVQKASFSMDPVYPWYGRTW